MDTGRTDRAAWVLHDDPPTTAMVRSLLTSEGFDVASVESPLRALADPAPRPPSLVLLGLTALDERDLELVAILRRRFPAARILVLFPAILRERAARCLALGADGYLPEPFYPAELAALTHRIVGGPAPPPGNPAGASSAASAEPSRRADETLGRLAAGVAHTVRNPLQILELQVGSFETEGKLDADVVREQIRRIALVAESLVRFAGRRRLSTRVVEVNALVQRVFETSEKDPSPKRRLTLTRDRLEVLGAPDLLRAAFEALRDRGDRITPTDGRIDVATRTLQENGSSFAEISVTDGGPVRRDVESLFDPFPDGDAGTEGSGLEMAAAAGIVRNHGGGVSARPAGAVGTTIVVRLPLRARGAEGAPVRGEESS